MAQEVGQQININPLDLNQNVAVGVVFPFNGNAVFNSSYTTQDQVKSNLINVLLTEPGERIYEPNFGVGLKKLLFENQIKEDELESRIKDQSALYVPEIEITNLIIQLIPDSHTLYVRLTYKFIINNTTDSIQLNFR
jgi:phage baseplate assembly protein W|tara:strand:+ start:1263 stop:1673 length:411 start_codon:yes stop_codon:yes gene_type:complete